MFYAKYSLYGAEHSELYFDHDTYHKQTYSPCTKDIEYISFTVHGENYMDRKSSVMRKAIKWSNIDASGLSYNELNIIQNWFYTNGRRYGLLKVFKENGIC